MLQLSFRVRPHFFMKRKTLHRRSSCSCSDKPKTSMSPISQTTPDKPNSIGDILCWKNLGALQILKSKWLKQKWPNGVINIVNKQESLDSLICQKPLLGSSFEKNFAHDSWPRTWSTCGSGCFSRFTEAFTHSQILELRLGTNTMPAHHQ